MTRRYRLVFLFLALILLFAVSLAVGIPITIDSFWLSSGILLLLFLSLVDQPHFSKDANVFVNGVTGLLALLIVPDDSRDPIWTAFLLFSLYLVASSYILMLLRSRPLHREGKWIALTTRINREIGRPEAIFSAFFLWGVLAQFGPNSEAFRGLLAFWAAFMILNLPGVAAGIARILPHRAVKASDLGILHKMVHPRIAEILVGPGAERSLIGRRGQIFGRDSEPAGSITIIDDRVMDGIRIARAAITSTSSRSHSSLEAAAQRARVELLDDESLVQPEQSPPISVVEAGSDITNLRFVLNPDVEMEEGELVCVERPSRDLAYYQIVSAQVIEKVLETGYELQSVRVTASQLGIWSADHCRFEPITWVAPAGGIVRRVSQAVPDSFAIPEGHVGVGRVPNSQFPVHVNIEDSVTHNTAVIGVTGSGKSYLAIRLIEAMVEKGLKVLILDVTRQHWSFLEHEEPQALRKPSDVETWLARTDKPIGVYQFADATSFPEATARFDETAFTNLSKDVTLKPGVNEPARLCIVLEEAHSLIPEWNQVAVQSDKDHVNRTAKFILQGRKFGMGCLVITQRTANVTKTILNQCNTILALQSFDQTGLDFLRNYMGEEYAHAISTLPVRHAVLVGKASSSTRPILFKIEDYSRRWIEIPNLPTMSPTAVDGDSDRPEGLSGTGATDSPDIP